MSQLIIPPTYAVRPMRPEGLRRVTAESFRARGDHPKHRARLMVAHEMLRSFTSRHARVLTLPGPWWRFERLVRSMARQDRRDISFVGYERRGKLFDLGSMNLDSAKRTRQVDTDSQGRLRVRNGRTVLIWGDILSVIEGDRPPTADAAWFDFCAPISTRMLAALGTVSQLISGLLFVTVMIGREPDGHIQAPPDDYIAVATNRRVLWFHEYKWGRAPMLLIALSMRDVIRTA